MGDRLQAGEPSRYVTSYPGQLSLAIPPWVGVMSISESWDINRHTARCTRPISVVSQCKLVSGWGLKEQRSALPCGLYGWGRTSRYIYELSMVENFAFAVRITVKYLLCIVIQTCESWNTVVRPNIHRVSTLHRNWVIVMTLRIGHFSKFFH